MPSQLACWSHGAESDDISTDVSWCACPASAVIATGAADESTGIAVDTSGASINASARRLCSTDVGVNDIAGTINRIG